MLKCNTRQKYSSLIPFPSVSRQIITNQLMCYFLPPKSICIYNIKTSINLWIIILKKFFKIIFSIFSMIINITNIIHCHWFFPLISEIIIFGKNHYYKLKIWFSLNKQRKNSITYSLSNLILIDWIFLDNSYYHFLNFKYYLIIKYKYKLIFT